MGAHGGLTLYITLSITTVVALLVSRTAVTKYGNLNRNGIPLQLWGQKSEETVSAGLFFFSEACGGESGPCHFEWFPGNPENSLAQKSVTVTDTVLSSVWAFVSTFLLFIRTPVLLD